MATRPFLILTLRRTGGTSLMALLSEVSHFPTLQDEPFNPDRVLKHVSEYFKQTRDVKTLRALIKAALVTNPNIKHCFEIIAEEITHELIREAVERGYRIFLLTRADEAARLRSLLLAQTTGAWGSKDAQKIYPAIKSGETVLKPVDLRAVSHRANHDRQSLDKIVRFLADHDIDYTPIVFEEFYARDGGVIQRVHDALAHIGFKIREDDPRLVRFDQDRGQTSSDIAQWVPNMAEVDELLRRETSR